ncbi:MAG: aldo/keto reductase [Planktothrix agardhii]|uniref:aldo/keto reductase n=1 Tax=Planktothrix agardhii TaxID=1160 RepID=UPI003C31302E
MKLTDSSRFQFTEDLNICRILNGMWQVSGAHGRINPTVALESMFKYLDAGYTTWDLADHYGPAEDFIGEFRRQLISTRGQEALSQVQAFTKWVPRPGKITKALVEKNIDISRQRMGVDCLDLLQFHWWDYRDQNYLDALNYLAQLQTEGKIKHLALTNFDTQHLKIIVENGIKIVSNQVQFSLVDRRPLAQMTEFCQDHNIKLLPYGVLCGGFLSEKYLGKPEPNGFNLETVSLKKYKNMINAWGGWNLFQTLLKTLNVIAQKHQVTIPNIAVRYILEQPTVAGAMVGTRLGLSDHIKDNAKVFEFSLDSEDYQNINSVLFQSQDLMEIIGDCCDDYR